MSKLKFNKQKIEAIIQKTLPKSKVDRYEQFSTGLVSPTFKIKINNPSTFLVVKLSKLKNKCRISLNNKILNYLNKHNIPAPKVYFEGQMDKKFISIMEYSLGSVASSVYKKGNRNLKENILSNAGENLKRIHNLKIPPFWIHQHHEIENQKEWKKWTQLRIDKYLKFFTKKFNNNFSSIEEELRDFW